MKNTLNNPDVIIIGAGLGGVITGALLASQEKMKVLVLEKEAKVGGRQISFGGPWGKYSEQEFRHLLKNCAGVEILKSEPPLSEIIEDLDIFENHVLDPGVQMLSGGLRNRYGLLAKAMGKDLRLSPFSGMAIWDDEQKKYADTNQRFGSWPKESFAERARLARTLYTITNEEAAEYDHISLAEYLEYMTPDENVRDFYRTLARWQMGSSDLKTISAGMWIKFVNYNNSTGLDVTNGVTAYISGGGQSSPTLFASIIEENGGEIRTNTKVKEVVIDNYEAKKVIVEQDGQISEIEAPIVVSNMPMSKVFDVIPEADFPEDVQKRIKNQTPLVSLVGYFKLKESIAHPDMPRATYVVDPLPGGPEVTVSSEGDRGPGWFQWELPSVVDPSRLLDGKGAIMDTWMAIDHRDLRDNDLIEKLIEAKLNFFRDNYPGFDDNLEWYYVGAAGGVTQLPYVGAVGDRRPKVKHPLVKNLYFTGDLFTDWDIVSNAAAHSGIACASAVSGRDYMKLLPPYAR